MSLLDCASANSIWRGYDYYKGKLVCYFEVWDDGSIEQISVSKKDYPLHMKELSVEKQKFMLFGPDSGKAIFL